MSEVLSFGDNKRATGFTNPVKCAQVCLGCLGLPVDEASFDRVAEIIGDSPPEVLAQGFIIYGMNELQHLCKIGGFALATPPDQPDGSPIRCYTAGEWAALNGNLQ